MDGTTSFGIIGGVAAVSAAVGMAARYLALRLGGLKPRRRRRAGRGAGIVELVSRSIPASVTSEAAAREAIERSGQRIDPSALWALRVLGVGLGAIVGTLVASSSTSLAAWLLPPALAAAGALAPSAWLVVAGGRWRADIERELPNALDLMGVSVAAGTSFEAAVRIVAERTQGALADSLSDVVAAAEFTSMTEALETLADRAQVEPLTVFVASLAQAQRSGIPVAEILHSQATSVRTYRRQRIEEQINRLSTRMLLPQLLIFAAVLVAILVPTISQVIESLA